MLVTPRPGVDRRNLVASLRSVHTDVLNLRGGGPQGAYKRLLAYLDWTSSAVRMLGNQISNTDLDRLVLTRRLLFVVSRANPSFPPGSHSSDLQLPSHRHWSPSF